MLICLGPVAAGWITISRGHRESFLARAAGQRAAVGKSGVVPRLVGEPEPTDILDAVEGNTTAHIEASAVVFERRDVRLNGLVCHGSLT